MKTSTAVALATAIALGIGLTVGLAIARMGNHGGDDAALEQVLSRLDALEAQQPERATHRQTSGFYPPGVTSPITLGHGGAPAPLARKAMEAAEQQRIRAMEARFASDPRDAGAPGVEIKMLKTMTDKGLAAMGETPIDPDVECHRNSCRITAQFGQSDDAMDWALNYVTLLGNGMVSNAQPVVVRNADGSSQLRLYAGRGSAR